MACLVPTKGLIPELCPADNLQPSPVRAAEQLNMIFRIDLIGDLPHLNLPSDYCRLAPLRRPHHREKAAEP